MSACLPLRAVAPNGLLQERAGLTAALESMRPGDTRVVWKLDRLGRSLKQLIPTVTALQARGIGFKSLTEQIDTHRLLQVGAANRRW